MENSERRGQWDNIYRGNELKDLNWFQPSPVPSLDFILRLNIPFTAKIIDVGGGDSLFVDHLLYLGFEDITVLDISELAINRAKKRLGKKADKVKWIVADVTAFAPVEKYDLWHDRATFHFLTEKKDIENYVEVVQQSVLSSGILLIGAFSEEGPQDCIGMKIQQYSETSMTESLKKFFQKIWCISIDHKTPVDTFQNFIFCSFMKMQVD